MNWNIPQNISITGLDDRIDDGAELTTITVSVNDALSDDSFDLLTDQMINATTTDDDTRGVSISTISNHTTESGMNAEFSVVLTSQPMEDVTIGFSSSDPTEGTVTNTPLKFTPTSWNSPQTVSVTAVNDDIDDGDIEFLIQTDFVTGGDYTGAAGRNIGVTNVDDDTRGITVSEISGTSTEQGGTASFTIELASQPTGNVTIPLASSDLSEGTVSPATITLTPANWNSAQTITVTGTNDHVDDGDLAFTIVTEAAEGGDYTGIDAADVGVTNMDDDVRGVAVSAISGPTTEAGGSTTFTVVLVSQPTADVTIDLSSDDASEGVTADSILVFTPTNWNQIQTVSVIGVDDDIDDGHVLFNVRTSARGGDYQGVDVADVRVRNHDNDTRGISVSTISGPTSESGGIASFTLVLLSQPTADVAIGVSTSDTSEGTVPDSPIVFSSGNWNLPQTVVVTGIDDDVKDGDVSFQIIVSPASGGGYTGLNAPDVTVVNADNDLSLDYGDAPRIYPVTQERNGASHVRGSLFFGATVDTEPDGQPSGLADADGADEDGIISTATRITSRSVSTGSSFQIAASETGKLDAWIDFNQDGDWNDPDEQIFASRALSNGPNLLPYTIPAGALPGQTAARFRISTEGGLLPTGLASDGEVEDYLLDIIEGEVSPDVTVKIVGGSILLTRDTTDNIVRSDGTEVFRALASLTDRLQINGSSSNDSITIDYASGLELPAGGLRIHGVAGANTLSLVGAGSLDFTDPRIVITDIGKITMPRTGDNQMTLDASAVDRLSPDAKSIVIEAGIDTSIDIADAANWRLGDPTIVDGNFMLNGINSDASQVIQVNSPRPWKNFINPGDVNNSGSVTASDALAVINELIRRKYSDAATNVLHSPIDLDAHPHAYFDRSGDDRLTALDALRVINDLIQGRNGAGESEAVATNANFSITKAEQDRVMTIRSDKFPESLGAESKLVQSSEDDHQHQRNSGQVSQPEEPRNAELNEKAVDQLLGNSKHLDTLWQ